MTNWYPSLTLNPTNLLETIALIAMAVLFYTYIGYPILLAALGLLRNRPKPEISHTPPISLLIAAYNEEAAIRRKLKQSLELEYPADKLEIVVVSDGSQDRTDEIVESIGDARVRL